MLTKQRSRNLIFALVPALISPTLAVLAQERNSQKQQAEEPSAKSIVVPPPPLIIKRNPNAISIPQSDGKPAGKFEEHNAVATTAKVGSSFGYRRDPFTRRARFHSGLDIKARLGDPVGASLGGVVQYAGWYHGYGNVVIVEHGGGVATHYAHLSAFAVEVGQEVARGTIVGYAGSTGRATSPHLHYEVRIAGNPVNPLEAVALDVDSEYFTRKRPSGEAGESTLATQQAVHTLDLPVRQSALKPTLVSVPLTVAPVQPIHASPLPLALPVSSAASKSTLVSVPLALVPAQPIEASPLPVRTILPPRATSELATLASRQETTGPATTSSLLIPTSSEGSIGLAPIPVAQAQPDGAQDAGSDQQSAATRARRVMHPASPLVEATPAAGTKVQLNSTRPRRVVAAGTK